jgi:hypothetical protein
MLNRMSTAAKYGISLTAGVVLELAGLAWWIFAEGFNPCHSPHPPPPLSPSVTFLFPYVSTVATLEGGVAEAIAILNLFQMPIYGWILGRAWTRDRFWQVATILVCLHFFVALASLYFHNK